MKQRIIALCLTLALALSLGAVSALAEEQTPETEKAAGSESAVSEDGDAAGETAEDGEEEAPSPAGPDAEDAPAEAYQPDAVGAVSFANLERRMRENNLNVLALQESIESINALNYDKMYEDLRQSLNKIANAQWGMISAGGLPQDNPYYMPMDSYAYGQMDQAYNAMRKQFDAIKDGDLQKDNAGAIRQLKNLQDQVIMAGESMYVALTAMETQAASLQRQLAALNRTVEEMELRYQLGQVSALQLQQTKAGRTALVSGLDTLNMNIGTYKCQLEVLIGAEISGTIALGAVPAVTDAQLGAMDLEKDLAAAKEVSYALYDAEETLKDDKETYIKSLTGTYYLREPGEHTWRAAQHAYNATVQNYELSFRTLHAQVGDYKQIFEASKVSLASQQASYASTKLKYEQGSISQNTLLNAEDDLRAAEDAVQSASTDLFSAYNTYCWAAEHGILN